MKLKITNNNVTAFSGVLYLSLLIGFFYGENLNYGAYRDWSGSNAILINDFSNNFLHTLLNYDDYAHRHSPIYLIFLSLFLDLGFDINEVRIIHLHLSILLIVFFYKCLRLKFNNVVSNHLILLSLVIFLSPTFRSLSIWPDSRLPGLTLFVLTIYFFLRFKKTNFYKYTWYTCLALIASSYVSPNFAIFFPYFFFHFLNEFKFFKLKLLIFFNFLASLPILYYIFILEINFLTAGQTPGLNGEAVDFDFNFSNKLMLISSIIFFHLSTILIQRKFYKSFFKFLLNKSIILFLLIVCLIYFFNYQFSYTGGGIFFILSNLLLDNNYLFFITSFFFIGFTTYIAFLNMNNFFLLSILIISNIQNTIYHKYYEPLIIIMYFTLLKQVDTKNFFKKESNLFYLYCLSFAYILMRIFKIKYLV